VLQHGHALVEKRPAPVSDAWHALEYEQLGWIVAKALRASHISRRVRWLNAWYLGVVLRLWLSRTEKPLHGAKRKMI